MLWPGMFSIPLSILAGTGAGLVVKYLLDKKYIFEFKSHSLKHDGETFVIYSLMGLMTTAIFWLFELGFEWIFHDKFWRYVGAVLGLAIGYFIKYQLDSRYVFRVSKS